MELHEPKLIQEWQAAFSEFKHCDIPDHYKKVSDHSDINELCTSTQSYGVKTTIVNKEDATKFNIPSAAYRNTDINEVVCNASINNSHYFAESEKYSQKDIPFRANINEVWETRFRNLAKHTDVITVIDRYFFANLETDINVRKTSIKRFADFLRPFNKKFPLSIYSVGEERNSSRHLCIEKYLRDNYTEGDRLGDVFSFIELSSCVDEKFRDESHDRLIRFDKFVYSIGVGFEIFRAFPLKAATFSVKNLMYTNFVQATSSMSPNRLWRESSPL